jgi:Protein of unknown function (DUF2480)
MLRDSGMENGIVNRVSTSSLITLDLEEFYVAGERVVFDIKDLLFQEMVLKEKDFREFIKGHDWKQYSGKLIAITCSADAVVPTWAFMLLSVALQPFAKKVFFGNLVELESNLFSEALSVVDWNQYRDAKVVIKGCSKIEVPVSAFVEATNRLRPLAVSIMFGEPCSTVPLYKKSKA